MVDSQQDAIAAALVELGYDFPREVTVAGVARRLPGRRACSRRATSSPRSNGTEPCTPSTSCAPRCARTAPRRPREPRSSCATASRADARGHARSSATARSCSASACACDYEFPIDVDDPARQRRRPERRHDVRPRHHRQADPRRDDRRRERRRHRHDRLGRRGRRRSAASGRSSGAPRTPVPTGSSHPSRTATRSPATCPTGSSVFAVSTLDEARDDRRGDRRGRRHLAASRSLPSGLNSRFQGSRP